MKERRWALCVFLLLFLCLCGETPRAQERWGSCAWVPVGTPSHQAGPDWCPRGYFLTQFDLDGDRRFDPHDAPIVGQASCCSSAGRAGWSSCGWVPVGVRSHQPGPDWCPPGSFLTQFDLDGDRRYDAYDTPLVGQAKCCAAGTGVSRWSRCQWVPVGRRSHQPGPPWCPEGSFLTQFDLDGDRGLSPWDAPIVGQAKCCTP